MVILVLLLLELGAWAQPLVRREGALIFDGIPAFPEPLKQLYEPYTKAYGATLSCQDAEGGLWMSGRDAQTLILARLDTPGGALESKLEIKGGFSNPRQRPRKAAASGSSAGGLLLERDAGAGAEIPQLYFLPEGQGETPRLLTNGRSHYFNPLWSPDGEHIVCASDERNGRDLDVTIISLDGHRRPLTQLAGIWTPLRWSGQGGLLLVGRQVAGKQRFYLLDLATNSLRAVESNQQPVNGECPVFTRSGRLLYLSDRDGEHRELYQWDPEKGGASRCLLSLQWDIVSLSYDAQRERIVYVVNEHGRSAFYSWQPAQGPPRRLNIPEGIAGRTLLLQGGRGLAFELDTGVNPSNIYCYSFETGEATCWLQGSAGAHRRPATPRPRLVHYPSFDGRDIYAYVYLPAGKGPFPTLLLIHGGPEAQYRPAFSPFIDFLTRELGVAVVAPNIRGSDGYGKTFRALDDGPLREDAIRDVGALLDWVGRQPRLDASRVAISGASYGGYVVLASLIRYPDRLAAGIDLCGVSDIATCLTERPKEFSKESRRHEYGDERDPAVIGYLNSISPLREAGKIRAPLLVAHGANDTRVPIEQADRVVKALRSQGKECWYLRLEQEGHSFSSSASLTAYNLTVAQFLQRFLL